MCAHQPDGPRDREDGREQIRRNPERVVNRRGIEIDVRVQVLLFLHQLRDPLRHPDPLRLAQFLAQLYRHLLQMRRARIERLVNAMADAHDLFLLRELLLDVGVDPIFRADFLQHLDDAFIRAAVERTLQRPDRGRDRGINVAQGRDRDARAEGRSIHAVIGVQHESHIERVGRFLRRRFAST